MSATLDLAAEALRAAVTAEHAAVTAFACATTAADQIADLNLGTSTDADLGRAALAVGRARMRAAAASRAARHAVDALTALTDHNPEGDTR